MLNRAEVLIIISLLMVALSLFMLLIRVQQFEKIKAGIPNVALTYQASKRCDFWLLSLMAWGHSAFLGMAFLFAGYGDGF
jgi:hypothetical protein